jgi:hypothetical protein
MMKGGRVVGVDVLHCDIVGLRASRPPFYVIPLLR